MKFIISNANEVDTLEVETDGNTVTAVKYLTVPKNGKQDLTPEKLQQEISLYMTGPNKTVGDALSAYVGGYNSVRKVED